MAFAHAKLEFREEDLSWRYNSGSHQHRVFRDTGLNEITKELQAKA